MLPSHPGRDGIAGTVAPNPEASRSEPDCDMEAELVAVESVSLTKESRLPAKPQSKKRLLKVAGAAGSEG